MNNNQTAEEMLNSIDASADESFTKSPVGELSRVNPNHSIDDILNNTTIMMVDDATTTLKVLQAFLEDAGYRHFLAVSQPAEAFQVLIDEMPDVVLLDINMPEVSGFDILSFMRSREIFQHTPVIVLTSSNDAETKLRALQLGATDFLAKPVDESELVLRLRNTLVAKRYMDQQSYYDRVTGLANRRLFLDRLGRVISWSARNSKNCAVLMVDVDRFKKINDSLGHSVGDDLLHAIARRLEGLVRANDLDRSADSAPSRGCLARIGGDEYTLLLSDVDGVAVVSRIAERILTELAKCFHIQGQELFITASVGIALSPENGEDRDSLLRHADIAMSHAKKQGRNCHRVYSKELDSKNKHLLQLEGELHKAIEREEFVLHYQPKVDVRTGFVVGAETLVRWDHPERGMVPPQEFITLAEDTGLIGEIGDWVLSNACQQNATWHAQGLVMQLAVNVSGHQFRNRDLVRQVRIALEETGLPPHFLTLELTEGVVIEDAKENIEVLHALKELGVSLSVDDFGTGYSSLSYLEQFPLDELKIDRAFISKIDSLTGEAPIVSALIAMAHSLRFSVVAEGVETDQQLDFLRKHKCEQYQGYLFSKPLPAEDFSTLAVNWRPARI